MLYGMIVGAIIFCAGAKIGKKASKKFEDFNDKMQK